MAENHQPNNTRRMQRRIDNESGNGRELVEKKKTAERDKNVVQLPLLLLLLLALPWVIEAIEQFSGESIRE